MHRNIPFDASKYPFRCIAGNASLECFWAMCEKFLLVMAGSLGCPSGSILIGVKENIDPGHGSGGLSSTDSVTWNLQIRLQAMTDALPVPVS